MKRNLQPNVGANYCRHDDSATKNLPIVNQNLFWRPIISYVLQDYAWRDESIIHWTTATVSAIPRASVALTALRPTWGCVIVACWDVPKPHIGEQLKGWSNSDSVWCQVVSILFQEQTEENPSYSSTTHENKRDKLNKLLQYIFELVGI